MSDGVAERDWQGVLAPPWKVVAASVRGPAHAGEDRPRQDAVAFRIDGQRLVAVVSDGAGSAALAEIGAEATASRMSEALAAIPLDPVADGPEVWRPPVEAAIGSLRDHLAERGRECGEGLDAFHATLVAVVATPAGGLMIHIGDGTIQATGNEDDPLAPVAISYPANGEEANVTFFVTLPFWRETLRLTPFGPCRRLVAMTDGPMPFAAAKRAEGLEPAFMGPVDAYLLAAPAEEGAEALADTLEAPQARRISGDDKTLLWAAVV
jgi:hypothetical protein